MALTKLILSPLYVGYAITPSKETISVQLDGGASRFRKDFSGAPFVVDVAWKANSRKYKYLWCFYRGISESGALPFLIDLKLDDFEEDEYTAHFLSFRVESISGNVYSVMAQLEVIPNDVTDTYADYVYMFNEFGENFESSTFLDDLDTLVNVTLPSDLPGSP